MIEVRTAVVETFAAEESQARRMRRNHEAECIGRVLLGTLQERRGENHDLVGDRERREHPAAADDDAGVRLLLDPGREERICLPRLIHGTIRLGRNERVSEAQVVLAQILVIADGIRAETRIRFSEERRAGGVSRHGAIDVIGNASHHAVRVVRPDAHGRRDAAKLLAGFRQHERARYFFSARGRVEQRPVGVLPLKVVQARERMHPALKGGVGRHVADRLSPIPEGRREFAQPGEDLVPAPCSAARGAGEPGRCRFVAHEGARQSSGNRE